MSHLQADAKAVMFFFNRSVILFCVAELTCFFYELSLFLYIASNSLKAAPEMPLRCLLPQLFHHLASLQSSLTYDVTLALLLFSLFLFP